MQSGCKVVMNAETYEHRFVNSFRENPGSKPALTERGPSPLRTKRHINALGNHGSSRRSHRHRAALSSISCHGSVRPGPSASPTSASFEKSRAIREDLCAPAPPTAPVSTPAGGRPRPEVAVLPSTTARSATSPVSLGRGMQSPRGHLLRYDFLSSTPSLRVSLS